MILERLEVDTELSSMSTDIAEGNSRRLLHHITEATGEDELTRLPWLKAALDEENLPTDAGPSQTDDDTCVLVALILIARIDGLAEVLTYELGGDGLGELLLGSGSPSKLTHDGSDLLCQGAHTALTSVLLDDEIESTRGEVDVLYLESVLLGFLGYEVLLGDLQLLLCDVARDFDELHTVT